MAELLDREKGVLSTSTSTLVTVGSGKKWVQVDIVLFNRNSAEREVELWEGGTGDGDRFFRKTLDGYETYPIVYKQKLPSSTTISGKADNGSSVNWFLTALEVDA